MAACTSPRALAETSITGSERLRVMEAEGPAYEEKQLRAVEEARTADRPPVDKWKRA